MRTLDENACMSFNQIAKEMGIKQQTVYKAYQNGMKKLRERPQMLLKLARIAGDLKAARAERVRA